MTGSARLWRLWLHVAILAAATSLTPFLADSVGGREVVAATALVAPDWDGAICHNATGCAASALLRLAQTRTEVPGAEMKAVTPAPAFADSEPPLWDGLGSVTYRIT